MTVSISTIQHGDMIRFDGAGKVYAIAYVERTEFPYGLSASFLKLASHTAKITRKGALILGISQDDTTVLESVPATPLSPVSAKATPIALLNSPRALYECAVADASYNVRIVVEVLE